MELGYEFQWKPYSLPFIIMPSGRRITLRVDNYVPVLDAEMYTIMPKDTVSSIFSAPARVKRDNREPEMDAPSVGSAGAGGDDTTPPAEGGSAGHAGAASRDDARGGSSAGHAGAASHDDPEPDGSTATSLRKQAQELRHLMTHFPKNPYCPACNHARLRRAPIGVRNRGWRATQAVKFGDVITCDHIILGRIDNNPAVEGRRTAMTIYDVGTKFLGCYPLVNKTAEQATVALRHFIGSQKIKLLHSDGSGEIEKAAADLGIPHDLSHP